MILALDAGNSSLKSAFFDSSPQPQAVSQLTYGEKKLDDYLDSLLTRYPLDGVYLSTVVPSLALRISQYCGSRGVSFTQFKPEQQKRISLTYSGTIGPDRIAALYGGLALFPETNLVVVDAGTAVTVDLVSSDGIFLGGYIFPGFELSATLLLERASMINKEPELAVSTAPGLSTAACLGNGVSALYAGGVGHMVKEAEQIFDGDDFLLIGTGGEIGTINKLLYRRKVTVTDHLVLVGLYFYAQDTRKA